MNLYRFLTVLVTFYVVEGQSPCTTPSGGPGKCVSLYDCNELLTIVNKPNKSKKEIANLRQSSCGFEGNIPKVCCPVAEQSTSCLTPDFQQGQCMGLYSCQPLLNYLKPPITQESITFVQNSRCQGADRYSVCCGPPPNPTPKPISDCKDQSSTAPPDPASGCCGKQGKWGDRIIGGNITNIDEYPWLALIEYSKNNKVKLLCGGVLISNRYTLTAGHCVVGDVLKVGTPRSVRLGEYDTTNDINQKDCVTVSGGGIDCTDGAISIPIEKITAHPNYNPYDTKTRRHDIALLRLTKPAPYSDFIHPICLPTSDLTLSPPSGWQLIAAGWGAINSTHGQSNVKLDVDLPFVPHSVCQPAYSVSRRKVDLWQGQMCAGGQEGKDSCRGDSGGPLMWDNPGKDNITEVIGIVSFGPTPCGMENVPGVYTKVYEYNSWIRQNITP